MMRTLLTLACAAQAAALSLTVAGCGGSALGGSADQKQDGDVLKIGMLTPLSGVSASSGTEMRNGAQLYLDIHGSRIGGRKARLNVADEQSGNTSAAVAAAQALLRQERVSAVVGVTASATAVAIKNMFDQAHVPLVVTNAGANAITGKLRSPYIWRTSFANCQPGAAAGALLAHSIHGSLYLAAPDVASSDEHLGTLRKEYTKAGGAIAGTARFPLTTTDFQPYLSKILSSGAKAVYLYDAGGSAVQFIKQYQQFGLKNRIPLYGVGLATASDVLKAEGDAAVGVQTVMNYSTELDNPANHAFVASYRKRYGTDPGVYAADAFDGMALLDKAFTAAKGKGGNALVQALSQVRTLDSPRGPLTLDGGHNPVQHFYLLQVGKKAGVLTNTVVKDIGTVGDCASGS